MRRTTIWVVATAAAALLIPTTVATAAAPPPPPPAFNHPGVLVSKPGLDLVKLKLAAGAEPWRSAYADLRRDYHASLSWRPHPRSQVDCGSSSNPDHGCTDEREDATAAYTHALIWYLSHDARSAAKAIQILNAWASVLRKHTNHNAPLQAGWAATTFARAAELIRYSDAGWKASDVTKFGGMLRSAFLPVLVNGAPGANGNWELIMIDAMAGIAVFLDDHALFTRAVGMWRKRIPPTST